MKDIGLEVLLLASGFYTLIAIGVFIVSLHTKKIVEANDKESREQLKTMRTEISEIKGVVKKELGDFLKQFKN